MDDLYKEQIIDHYKNPRHFGEVEGAQVKVRESNASCGDMIEVSAKYGDKREVKFRGVGCAISVASTSMLLEKMEKEKWGRETIEKMKDEDLEELLGIKVNPTRRKCMNLGLRALQKAIKELEDRR